MLLHPPLQSLNQVGKRLGILKLGAKILLDGTQLFFFMNAL
jgi:hypothetical protein